jgi:hypothetical protein
MFSNSRIARKRIEGRTKRGLQFLKRLVRWSVRAAYFDCYSSGWQAAL